MIFGWTDADNVWRVIDEVFERGRMHLIQEYNKAQRAINSVRQSEIATIHHKGQLLLKYGGERELAMLDSVETLVPTSQKALSRIKYRKNQTRQTMKRLQEELLEEYYLKCKELGISPRKITLTPEEKKLGELIPIPIPGIMGTSSYHGNYYEKVLGKEKLSTFNLRPNFSYGIVGYTEAHNFINGKKSILEIFEATSAELWSEGYPEAHNITLEEVTNYMRMLEAAKIIALKKSSL